MPQGKVSTRDVLKESGFVSSPKGSLGLSPSLIFDFGNFQLSADGPMMNMSFRMIMMLSGHYRTLRTVGQVDFEMPETVDSHEQCWAWIAHFLDRQIGGSLVLDMEPEWLVAGRANEELLPWVKERSEREERQRIYAQRPHCLVDREWARFLLNSIKEEIEHRRSSKVQFHFDGGVLKVQCGERRWAVAGSGNAWPEACTVTAGLLKQLPRRLTRYSVEFGLRDGYLVIDGWKYPEDPLTRIRALVVTSSMTEDEARNQIQQFLLELCPYEWPERSYVYLDEVGIHWLDQVIGEPAVEILFGAHAGDNEHTAQGIAEAYHEDRAPSALRPSECSEDEERLDDVAVYKEEFLGFLKAWRKHVLDTFERTQTN